MLRRRQVCTTLLALAAVALFSQTAPRTGAPGSFGLSADVDPFRFELRLDLVMLCLRLEAGFPDEFTASAQLLSCGDGTCLHPRGSWSPGQWS